MNRSLVALGLAPSLLILAACGGSVSYLGDLAPASDAGATPDAASLLDAASADGGSPIECVRWGGTCRGHAKDTPSCEASESLTSDGVHGCPGSDVCCVPSCYPSSPQCPPGMMPSPLATGCPTCIPQPPSACRQQEGSCEVDDGTAATDPCTATGRPVLKLGCAQTNQVCCGAAPVPSTPCAQQGGTCIPGGNFGCNMGQSVVKTLSCGGDPVGDLCCMPMCTPANSACPPCAQQGGACAELGPGMNSPCAASGRAVLSLVCMNTTQVCCAAK